MQNYIFRRYHKKAVASRPQSQWPGCLETIGFEGTNMRSKTHQRRPTSSQNGVKMIQGTSQSTLGEQDRKNEGKRDRSAFAFGSHFWSKVDKNASTRAPGRPKGVKSPEKGPLKIHAKMDAEKG